MVKKYVKNISDSCEIWTHAGNPNRFRVYRLNRSAKLSHWWIYFLYNLIDFTILHHLSFTSFFVRKLASPKLAHSMQPRTTPQYFFQHLLPTNHDATILCLPSILKKTFSHRAPLTPCLSFFVDTNSYILSTLHCIPSPMDLKLQINSHQLMPNSNFVQSYQSSHKMWWI